VFIGSAQPSRKVNTRVLVPAGTPNSNGSRPNLIGSLTPAVQSSRPLHRLGAAMLSTLKTNESFHSRLLDPIRAESIHLLVKNAPRRALS